MLIDGGSISFQSDQSNSEALGDDLSAKKLSLFHIVNMADSKIRSIMAPVWAAKISPTITCLNDHMLLKCTQFDSIWRGTLHGTILAVHGRLKVLR